MSKRKERDELYFLVEERRLYRLHHGQKIARMQEDRKRYLRRALAVVYNSVPLAVAASIQRKIDELTLEGIRMDAVFDDRRDELQEAKRKALKRDPQWT